LVYGLRGHQKGEVDLSNLPDENPPLAGELADNLVSENEQL